MSTTPNMNLLLPAPTITPGPTYASENNTAFTTIDSHDHTSGKGLPVPSAGININGDLAFNNFNSLNLRSSQYYNQASPLSLPSDLTCLYVSQGNLYYNNQLGQQVQITAGASLNAASIGGIGGDYVTSGALVYYTSLTRTYTFTSATNTPGNIDGGSITIRPIALSPHGITISAPPGLGADYALTLPSALPGSTNFVTLDSSGNIAATTNLIGTANIASQAITQDKLAPKTVGTTVGIGGVATTTIPSGTTVGPQSYTPLSANITITTTGRPVRLEITPTYNTTSYFQFYGTAPSNTNVGISIGFYNVTTAIFSAAIQSGAIFPTTGVNEITIPASCFSFLDMSVNGVPGTYTYNCQIAVNAGTTAGYTNVNFTAYEI